MNSCFRTGADKELATARTLLASVEAAAVHLELEDCAAFEQALVGANERLRAALAVAGHKAAIAETRSGVPHPVRVSSRVGSMRLPGLTIEGISGVLIDLDGTMYNPRGLIPGAEDFFGFLCRRNIPFVLLSNTGAKGARGVQEKLLHLGHLHLRQELLPVSKILTAAEAQAAYMLDTCPAGAKIFAISGGSDPAFWMGLLRAEAERKGCDPGLVDSWDIRIQMTDPLAKEWAVCAAAHQHRPHVFVVLFFDGAISAAVDPISGELGHADWSFDFIKKVSLRPH